MNFSEIPQFDGVWSSFSLSYLADPHSFIDRLYVPLPPQGWIALVDVSCFVSGNMPKESFLHGLVKKFEIDSEDSGLYDFDFGSKMEKMLINIGFRIDHTDNDVLDLELNFDGMASDLVLMNWEARLRRMRGLKEVFPEHYTQIESELLLNLESKNHRRNRNVRFVVGRKI